MKNTTVHIILGIALILLGVAVLFGAQVFTTLLTTLLFGWALVAIGIVEALLGIYSYFTRQFVSGTIAILGGIISFVVGMLISANPTVTAVTFTFLIAMIFLIQGSFQIIINLMQRDASWGINLLGGIITLGLGILIFIGFPETGLYIIGLYIGIKLIIDGVTMVASANEGEVTTTRTRTSSGRYSYT